MLNQNSNGETTVNIGDQYEAPIGRIMRGKGFGFINMPTGQQLFFHSAQLRGEGKMDLLRVGDLVSFTIGTDQRNPSKKQANDIYPKVDLTGRTAAPPYVPAYESGGAGSYRPQQQRATYSQPYSPYQPQYGGAGPYGGAAGPYGGARTGFGGGYGRPSPYTPQYGAAPYNQQPTGEHQSGTIKQLNSGFGFISFNQEELFFPARNVLNNQFQNLQIGDSVLFAMGPDPKNPHKSLATQIKKANGSGTVDKLANGFGFLISDADKERLFFHSRHLQNASFEDLKVGSKLEYISAPSRNKAGGFEAQQIKVVGAAAAAEEKTEA